MPKLKLTKTNVVQIVKPESGQVDYYDTELHGFGIRATKAALTFFVRSTLRGTGKKPFVPIGRFGTFTTDTARTTAKDYLQRLDKGENPHPKMQVKREIITIKDLHSQYISSRKTPLAETTKYQYESWLNTYFKEWLRLPVWDITPTMINAKLTRLEKTAKVGGSNGVKFIGGLFRFGMAMHPEVITSNPVAAMKEIRGKDWSTHTRRKSLLTADTLPTWFKLVSEHHNPKAQVFMLLLLYTGLRRGEAARIKWADIDFKEKTFAFSPEKKRGIKPEDNRVTMPLSNQLHQLLLKSLANGWESEYVFTGRSMNPFVTNHDHWKRDIIEKSGVKFCFHDLRRTFITIAESLDIGHYTLKALLNHNIDNDVTGGYITMNTERLREPTQKVVDEIIKLATARVKDQQKKAA